MKTKITLRQLLAQLTGTVTVVEPMKDGSPADLTTFEVGKDMYSVLMDLPLDEHVLTVKDVDGMLTIVMEGTE